VFAPVPGRQILRIRTGLFFQFLPDAATSRTQASGAKYDVVFDSNVFAVMEASH